MDILSIPARVLLQIGLRSRQECEEYSLSPMKSQNRLLRHLVLANKDTEYGREYHFDRIHSIEDFQKYVPAGDYDHFAPYIERMVKGEKNILTTESIRHYNRSYGLLGTEKQIPVCERQIKSFNKFQHLYADALISRKRERGWRFGKGISLLEGRCEILPGGATYGTMTAASIARSDTLGPFHHILNHVFTSPSAARVPEPDTFTLYIHARYALMEANVTYACANFSSHLLELMRYIEKNWQLLVTDIAKGTIDESVSMSDEVRAELLQSLRPCPERGSQLKEIFNGGFAAPVVPKIWPLMRCICCVAGGDYTPYTEKLVEKYLGPDLHVVYLGLSASEGVFSIPLEVDEPDSMLFSENCFLEFRNIDPSKSQEYLTMNRLKQGECYELIVTNPSGLYRYRMGDVVRVTGYHHSAPMVRYERRLGDAINMFGEKTTDRALQQMAAETEKSLGLDMIDYSVFADYDREPAGYDIFLEIDSIPKAIKLETIRATLERELQIANPGYAKYLTEGHCGPVRLILLQRETYQLYRDMMTSRAASGAHIKPIHVISNEFQRRFFFGLEDKELEEALR